MESLNFIKCETIEDTEALYFDHYKNKKVRYVRSFGKMVSGDDLLVAFL